MNVTVYDFTGIYENESFDFYKKEGARSLFCSLKDISGTNCICDDYAYEEIRKRISALDIKGNEPRISFFDNGNYHYMSKVLLDVMCEAVSGGYANLDQRSDDENETNFDLIVFDHHPDMKWTSYGDILSCGSWILNTLKDRSEVRHVHVIGADKVLMEEAYADNPEITGRVSYYEAFEAFKRRIATGENAPEGKVYLSIDKDVLGRDELFTNWDQGDMTTTELKDALSFLKDFYKNRILAVDVCGECTKDSEEFFTPNGAQMSNEINRYIVSDFLNF